jgi:CIC family chloride channel protein
VPSHRALLIVAALAVVVAAATGLIGGAFRWLLIEATELRAELAAWAHSVPWGLPVPVVLAAVGAALAAAIVRLSPRAAGSGIQDVEAVFRAEITPPPLSVVPARFVGGVLSIGSGLVLGREGPTVHMGAAMGAAAARAGKLADEDARALHTAMAGAGLAVAFNAPVGGAIFVLEEVARSARLRVVLPTLLSVAVAVEFARLVIGDHPDFAVGILPSPPISALALFVVFGAVVGVVGVGYNVLVVGLLRWVSGVRRVPPVARAGLIGAVVGVLLSLDPRLGGGGDELSQALLTGQAIALTTVLLFLVVRFFVGPLSYAAGTPGGLFAPLLALGSLLGVAFSAVVDLVAPGFGPELAISMAIVGMSTLFAAVVRAPLTGIALVIEMTGTTAVTVPMLLAAGSAVLTATLLQSPPVYDSLRELEMQGIRR